MLVAGGTNSSRRGTYLASAERYDPTTNSLDAGGGDGRDRAAATRHPPARRDRCSSPAGRAAATPWRRRRRTTPAPTAGPPPPPMASGRWLHVAALLPGGQVLVAGGQGGSNTLATAETYDPGARRWLSGAR